jgi:hypothetical protein
VKMTCRCGSVVVVNQRDEGAAREGVTTPPEVALEGGIDADEPPVWVKDAEEIPGEIEKWLGSTRRHDEPRGILLHPAGRRHEK